MLAFALPPPLLASAAAVALIPMARRTAKAARKKDAKRQRAAEKRAERARNRALAPDTASPLAAGRRLLLLRDAVVKGEPPAPRGLTNLGNTCFFNAVMQNFSRIAPFRDYFVGTPPCPAEAPMTAALRSFFIAMWDVNTTSVFNPTNLFTEVGKNNPSFKGRAQQDSHELMRVVFDAVIEEEKKRLRNVAKGILPPTLDQDNSDESSESEIPLPAVEPTSPHQPAPAEPFIGPLPAPEPRSIAHSETSAPELPPGPADSDSASVESTTPPCSTSPEPANDDTVTDDTASDEEIPPEKLVTIIERTVGGLLSSTIECKECGSKSSVAEPFLDLQLPLVPRDEPEPRPTVTDTVKDKASKAASCLKLRRECGPKQEHEQETKPTCEEAGKEAEDPPAEAPSVPLAPPPPPPPPPLPAPPKRPDSIIGGSSTNCDLMQQIREAVAPSEPEPVHESRLIVYTGDAMTPNLAPASDTAAFFDNDDEDSEEFCSLSALFDDDLDEPEDSVVSTAANANATSAGGAAQPSASESTSTAAQAKPMVTAGPARKTSFISSLFGGLGGVSAAPHGYRSVVGSLEEFTKIEVLEGDNAYGCDECTRREKLRAALQSRRKLKTVSKKTCTSSNLAVNGDTRQINIDDSNPFRSQHAVSTVTNVQECSTLTSEKSMMSDVKARQDGTDVLMSSPVTSSESSSGVSSEDDGELVIEEELENPSVITEVVCELTREEEDEIIKQFNVKIPTVRTTAEKRLLIREAPNVFALQLKRFTQIGYRGGLRKISGHVGYPLVLDMTPFVEKTVNKESAPESNRKPDIAKRKRHSFEASQKKEKYEYVLTGVVVHGGSLTGGHYTAYVREGMESNARGGWYFCNDSKISRASEKDVLNSEAYLLYYERVHT